VAQVGTAKWRARTNRATPIAAGAELRVVAIDGVTLEVEPAEGGARDYREGRAKHTDHDGEQVDLAADDAESR
jgi:membrane-bound serine protease (ClpP class)